MYRQYPSDLGDGMARTVDRAMNSHELTKSGSEEIHGPTLRKALDEIVVELRGPEAEIAEIEHKLSDFASSYPAEILTVELVGGERLQMFLKNYGSSRIAKDAPDLRRDRELRVYRDLLPGTDLGTAAYHGSVWDDATGRFWLVLEFVEGVQVRSCGVPYWIRAAGWIGRLQARFASQLDRVAACDALAQHNDDYFRPKAKYALEQVGQVSPSLARRVAALLKPYDELVDVMLSQPRTLVHGAYRPANILLDLDAQPMRICPTDWELAAYGATMYDLAFFADGFQPPVLDEIFETYACEAAVGGVPVPERQQMHYVFDCFRLFRVINWLSRANQKNYPEAQVERLVRLGEQFCRTLA